MKKLKIAIILMLALVAGCSVNAGISRGQEVPSSIFSPPCLPHNKLFKGTDYIDKAQKLKDSLRAVMRVRVRDSYGQILHYGSCTAISRLGNRIYLLSNSHVFGDPNEYSSVEIDVVDKSGHKSIGWFKVKVLKSLMQDNIDASIAVIESGKTLAHVPCIPLSDQSVAKGDRIIAVGAGSARKPHLALGWAIKSQEDLLYYLPTSVGGMSGSPILNEDCTQVLALVAWRGYIPEHATSVGISQPVAALRKAFLENTFGKLPNYAYSECGDQIFGRRNPPKARPEAPSISDEELNDLFGQEPSEDAPEAPEGDLTEEGVIGGLGLKGLLQRLLRGQDELKAGQDKDNGAIGRLAGELFGLKSLITWLWRGVILVLVIGCIGLFAQQGWLLRISVTIIRIFVRSIRATFFVLADAVTTPIPKNASVEDQLRDIREQLQEDATSEQNTGKTD